MTFEFVISKERQRLRNLYKNSEISHLLAQVRNDSEAEIRFIHNPKSIRYCQEIAALLLRRSSR